MNMDNNIRVRITLPDGSSKNIFVDKNDKDERTIANELITLINGDPVLQQSVQAQRLTKTYRKLNFKVKKK